MLTAGLYHTLRVERISDFGLYLVDAEGEEVLLPNRYVSKENQVGDLIEVFVYNDSEDRPVATTAHPLVTVGQAAWLRVVDKTIHGAFLDWGLEAKDLFLPNRNQKGRVEIGRHTLVFLYTDNVTGRVVATNFLNGFINNLDLAIRPREAVEILIASETPVGYRAIVNHRHWGMLYHNQLFRPVEVGDRMGGYVSRITPEGRVDLALQRQGYDEVKEAADRLVELMREQGGSIALSDGSSPDEVHHLTGMSKKTFKRAMGYLMKQGRVEMSARETRLRER